MPRIVDTEVRRAELTGAAARVIARSGIEAATMREIAAEAGWTTGALTHYFSDKQELLLATFTASLAARHGLRAGREQSTAREQLRAALEGALPLDEDRCRHWLVTLTCCAQASGDERLARAQREAYREFRSHVAGLVLRAGLAPGPGAATLAEQLIALADGIAIQALFDPASWAPDRQLVAFDTALRAVIGPSGQNLRRDRAGDAPAI